MDSRHSGRSLNGGINTAGVRRASTEANEASVGVFYARWNPTGQDFSSYLFCLKIQKHFHSSRDFDPNLDPVDM